MKIFCEAKAYKNPLWTFCGNQRGKFRMLYMAYQPMFSNVTNAVQRMSP